MAERHAELIKVGESAGLKNAEGEFNFSQLIVDHYAWLEKILLPKRKLQSPPKKVGAG